MELDNSEAAQVRNYLAKDEKDLPKEILEKIEIGIWVFPPLPIGGLNIQGEDPKGEDESEPILLSGHFSPTRTLFIFRLFLENRIPYLLIRVGSWECYLNCNGEMLTEHCEENLDAVRDACERLRERCGSGVPGVRK